MSKLKVNEIESHTALKVKVKTTLETEAGLTNLGGVVSLGTQSAFSSTGIDDNASSTKVTLQDGSPQVNVAGVVQATGFQIGSTSVATGPSIRSRGTAKATLGITDFETNPDFVDDITDLAIVGNTFNCTGLTKIAGNSSTLFDNHDTGGSSYYGIKVGFDSTDFDGTNATVIVDTVSKFSDTGVHHYLIQKADDGFTIYHFVPATDGSTRKIEFSWLVVS